MDIIEIEDIPPTTIATKTDKPIYVQKYISNIEYVPSPITDTNISPNWQQETILINYDFINKTRKYIKTNKKFKQNNLEDFGYISSRTNDNSNIQHPIMWFKDEKDVSHINWYIEESNKKYKIINDVSNLYLGWNGNSVILSTSEFLWDIKSHQSYCYIINDNNLYLTWNQLNYRFTNSLTLETKNDTKNQLWKIEESEKTFTKKDIHQVLNYTNDKYIKQMMESKPLQERMKFVMDLAGITPQTNMHYILTFLKMMTQKFINKNPFIDDVAAIQYVSKYLLEKADEKKDEKKMLYVGGGSLLKNMYNHQINMNPNLNKKQILKNCVKSIME